MLNLMSLKSKFRRIVKKTCQTRQTRSRVRNWWLMIYHHSIEIKTKHKMPPLRTTLICLSNRTSQKWKRNQIEESWRRNGLSLTYFNSQRTNHPLSTIIWQIQMSLMRRKWKQPHSKKKQHHTSNNWTRRQSLRLLTLNLWSKKLMGRASQSWISL